MSSINTFLLPDLGEGLTEADLLSWSVAAGDTVQLNQIIAEVETAKAMVELPSPYAGIVRALHAEPGTTMLVGKALIDIEVSSDTEASGEPARTPLLVGYGVSEQTFQRRRRRNAPHPTPTASAPAASNRPLAAPPVRFAARANAIDLAEVRPTGAHGQVTRADLQDHLDRRLDGRDEAAPGRGGEAGSGETRTPVTGVRKHTAQAMVRSAFTAPHVTIFVDVDVTPTLDLMENLRASAVFADVRLTPLVFVARALILALRADPTLNSTWDEQHQEIVTKSQVNLGIAAATPRGLVVPNIKQAQRLNLVELAKALNELTTLARSGKTPPADLAQGSITITNIGVFGIDSGTPIINPGEAAILCFGSIRRRPWEYDGQIALRSITTLSLSFDHRLADGQQGAQLLAAVAGMLADPLTMFAMA